jgi:hypothetical protein
MVRLTLMRAVNVKLSLYLKRNKKLDGKPKLMIISLCGLLASGCTSLESTRLSDVQDGITPAGYPYRLPAKVFSITATYEITGCEQVGDHANLEASVETSYKESLVGTGAYTINHQDLNAWTKVTNTKFQSSEAGLLTGVNASIVDQSGAVIVNSVSAAASIARAIATSTLPLPVRMSITSPGQENKDVLLKLCTKVKEALEAKTASLNKLNTEKERDEHREDEQSKITGASLQINALNKLAATYNKLGYPDEQEKLHREEKLQQREKELAEAKLADLGKSKTDELTKKYATAKSKLIISASLDFLPDAQNKRMVVPVKVTDLKNLFGHEIDEKTVTIPQVVMTIEVVPGISGKEADMGPELKEAGKNQKKPPINGIAYRIPVAAFARIHVLENGSKSTLLSDKITQIPQLGPIGSINLINKMFDDNLIELAFNGATGAPNELIFRAKSKAEAASATARDAAGTYMQLQKDKRDDQLTANKALLDQATAQTTLGKAETELALSKVQANATTLKTNAELQQSLVNSRVELLRDQQRLDAVRTGTATAAEVELEALNTQQKLLAQRLQILKLEQEISEQKAKALSVNAP